MRFIRRLLALEFVRFCIVGSLGFTINYLLLTLLNEWLNSPLYVAQFLAAEVALFSNFVFHHRWTYKASKVRKTISTLIIQFHATSWVAVIGSVLMVTAGVKLLDLSNLVALIASSAIALFWNFSWSKYVIWHSKSDKHKNTESADTAVETAKP